MSAIANLRSAEATLIAQIDKATALVETIGTNTVDAALQRLALATQAAQERLQAKGRDAVQMLGVTLLADLEGIICDLGYDLEANEPAAPALPAPEPIEVCGSAPEPIEEPAPADLDTPVIGRNGHGFRCVTCLQPLTSEGCECDKRTHSVTSDSLLNWATDVEAATHKPIEDEPTRKPRGRRKKG